ncbi:uncharacterized protein LOC115874708 [Sitophilus oryzae]|uniref:Uncharacterized protein LOC115874708 n=1 Tax=Sitophilus oryzae TaxID=7048 RepID=A0A6J2X3U9_SITOR|nr:uncharacterized protein LOC115874708 [Sitophilus oryzae]
MSVGLITRSINIFKFTNIGIPSQSFRSICSCYNNVHYSNKPVRNIVAERDPETGQIKKKKLPIIPKVTLLHGEDITITTLEEAQKIAKRRDLKLVRIIDLDTKTQRPVYKLMTGAEYFQEDLKQRERKKAEKEKTGFKGEKVLMISQNISEHDLQTQINKVIKWLDKKYEIRVVINGDKDNSRKAENIYSQIENNLKQYGKILQTRQKGSDIKFQIIPPKQTNESKNSGGNSDGTNDKSS